MGSDNMRNAKRVQVAPTRIGCVVALLAIVLLTTRPASPVSTTAVTTLAPLAAMVVSASSGAGAGGGVLFVDDDAPADGDGLTWDTAYRFLQDALAFASDAANGITEIRVGQGVYKPDRDEANPEGTGDREATFALISNLTLAGGYAGIGADDPDARDVELYETILSGDLLGDDGLDFQDYDENAFNVLLAIETDRSSVLEGFVITAGNANGVTLPDQGGGIYMVDADTRIAFCRFYANSARYGGALFLNVGEPLIEDCVFEENRATDGGGALSTNDGSCPLVRRCLFRANTVGGSGGAVSAGGCPEFGPVFADCEFIDNFSLGKGGGKGGAFYGHHFNGLIARCAFINNTSGWNGGALSLDDASPTIINCAFVGNEATTEMSADGGGVASCGSGAPMLINCEFNGNKAVRAGGGLATDYNGGPVTVINCTFAQNEAQIGGGLSIAMGSNEPSVVINCILAKNVATEVGGTDQIDNDGEGLISYSCIEGEDDFGGEGNITDDPLFVDLVGRDGIPGTIDDDLRLQAGSPCLDAGDNGAVSLCVSDLDTRERFVDDPAVRDTGAGRAPLVDMGAYEALGARVSDCDSNGLVDDCEIALGLARDCDDNGIPDSCDAPPYDCNGNGIVDYCDIAEGLSGDVNENGVPDECEDCNLNGVMDLVDIAAGASEDQNGNGIPDECEIDCNGNGVRDLLDLAVGTSVDCNANGIPDECDVLGLLVLESDVLSPIGFEIPQSFVIATPAPALSDVAITFSAVADLASVVEFIDVDLNGVFLGSAFVEGASDCPERPEVDQIIVPAETYNLAILGQDAVIALAPSGAVNAAACDGESFVIVTITYLAGQSGDHNNNGVPDECEQDCNLNGISDEVDIAKGTSADCNDNGVPDECDTAQPFEAQSGDLSPIGFGVDQSFVLRSPPKAQGDVTLSFEAIADLATEIETITVALNGTPLAELFVIAASDCPRRPDAESIILEAQLFNNLVAVGDVEITMTASEDVNPDACDGESFISVSVAYSLGGTSEDLNGNGIPDECEVSGDLDGDGVVGPSDLVLLLGAWGGCDSCEGCLGDLDGDCVVGASDLVTLLGNWG